MTTATLSGTLNGSVYNSAVQVTLNPTDNLSGVQNTYYSLDGGASTTYSGAFNVTALGSHSVKFHSVDYAGNVESTKTVNFTISQASQTITFNNPGTQTYGHPLTLTATASSGLTVTYTSTTPTICTVSGSVVTFVTTGTCGMDANQAGNVDYSAAPQVGHAWVVGKSTQTITFNNPGTQTYGHPLTLTATASSGLTVTYTSTTPTICTVSGSVVTFVTTGTCGIAANQAGNVDYLAAPQVGHAWVVAKEAQTITFANPGTQRVGAVVPLGATASSGLTVSYTSTNTAVCTISGSNATMVAVGTCGVDANQAGNVDYLAAPEVGHAWVVTAH